MVSNEASVRNMYYMGITNIIEKHTNLLTIFYLQLLVFFAF